MRFIKYFSAFASMLSIFLAGCLSAAAQTGIVTADILNVRASTSVLAEVITKVSSGNELELLAYDGSWYKVCLSDGTIGYVSAEYISPNVAYYGVVTANSLTVRTCTGVDYPAIAHLPYGSVVELLAYDGSWYKIRFADGQTGFVCAEFISQDLSLATNPTTEYKYYGYINASFLNIRETTSIDSSVLTSLPQGTKVELLAYDGLWYRILLDEGNVGYASAEYISLTEVAPAAAASTPAPTEAYATPAPPVTEQDISLGNQIIQTAYQYIGLPYVYAAAGPSSFDCSGFTMYVMGLHGISLPHQSGSQYQHGYEVSKNSLIAGDLVFFNSAGDSAVSHVGIYIGDGQFIHASSGRAYSVTISSLSDDYYTKHYLGARRVI